MTDEESPTPRELRYAREGIAGLQPFLPGELLRNSDLNELVEAIKELDGRLRAIGG